MQINSVTKVNDRSVSSEITILTNVTDNEARYKCEASNAATEIPFFETVTLNVHCKLYIYFRNRIIKVFFKAVPSHNLVIPKNY